MLNALPGPTLWPLGDSSRRQDPDVDDEVTFPGGRGEGPEDSHHGLLAPSNRGHRMSYQYPSHWVVTKYSKNKCFQWQCHARKDRSVL